MDQGTFNQHSASYRDPSGFIFTLNNEVYRQVNLVYKQDFELLMSSGLYHELTQKDVLVKHEELRNNLTGQKDWYTTLKPEKLAYISYPYEWCFDQLKDAALLTLQIARTGIKHDMILKDATPFNIQLHGSKLVLIDSLSFEAYDASRPWVAYRQFCETFLAPLTLMHYHQQPFQPLLYAYPDGIPLAVASNLLPWQSKLNLHVYLHIHLQSRYAARKPSAGKNVSFSRQKLLNLLSSLQTAVESLTLKHKGVWSDYYREAQERAGYLADKTQIVTKWINNLPGIFTAVDLGANDGTFSEILSHKAITTISVDGDHFAVTKLYKSLLGKNRFIFPLVMDLANPSPSLGFNNNERNSFLERTKGDLVLALAFIHHLAIARNLPFAKLAPFFKALGKALIIEFVPKEDEKVLFMLAQRKDVFPWYTETEFIREFSKEFKIVASQKIADSNRVLYLMLAI